jgi:hypothetical protein
VNVLRDRFDNLAAPIMFSATLVYMLVLAMVLHRPEGSEFFSLYFA